MKNPETRRRGRFGRSPAPARVALTGTPVENRLTELWAILDWTTRACSALSTVHPPLAARSSATATPMPRRGSPARSVRSCCAARRPIRRRARAAAETETDRPVPLTSEQTTLYEAEVRERIARDRGKEGIERAGPRAPSCSPR